MNDPAAPGEQPPYIDRCRETRYAQLSSFIDHALERLSDSSAPADEEVPRSEEEFLALCDMLSGKAEALRDALRDVSPMSQRPACEGASGPGVVHSFRRARRFVRQAGALSEACGRGNRARRDHPLHRMGRSLA
jgi:hypothetical protein